MTICEPFAVAAMKPHKQKKRAYPARPFFALTMLTFKDYGLACRDPRLQIRERCACRDLGIHHAAIG
jgi:hypothetical protein